MSDVLSAVVDQAQTAYADGRAVQPRANRRGELVVADFWTQMLLDGRIYHIQFGTEDAPATATAAIDDQLAMAVIDQTGQYVMLPFAAQLKIANWSTSTLFNGMLEADLAKNRYSSGGTAFVPRNMRGDTPYSFNGAAYVAGASDITAAAKTAVPDSVEFWRGAVVEDAQATPDAAAADIGMNYSARTGSLVACVGTSSIVFHAGATTADPGVYGFLQVVQIDRAKTI